MRSTHQQLLRSASLKHRQAAQRAIGIGCHPLQQRFQVLQQSLHVLAGVAIDIVTYLQASCDRARSSDRAENPPKRLAPAERICSVLLFLRIPLADSCPTIGRF